MLSSSSRGLLSAALLTWATVACGGNARQAGPVPASGSGTGGGTSAGGAGLGGTPSASGSGAGGAGSAGLNLVDPIGCDTTRAADCRARIGDPFVEVTLGGVDRRYTLGCDPMCGAQQVPVAGSGLEGSNDFFVTGCDDAQRSVEVLFKQANTPAEITLCETVAHPSCVSYTLANWVDIEGGQLSFQGAAQASPVTDAGTGGELVLSYRVCQ